MSETVEAEVVEKETALAVLPAQAETPNKLPEDIVVVASNPQQMQAAQTSLIEHFAAKKKGLEAQLKEAKENLEIAKDRKWKVAPWQGHVRKAEKEIQFYDKVVALLDAGYVIVPNYPELDIFAIRTKKTKPKKNFTRGWSTGVDKPNQQVTDSPPLGEGRYVNADSRNSTWTDRKKLADGSLHETKVAVAVAFDEVDFPFKFAKPQILEKTSQAMKILAFDDIGIIPRRRIKRGDPMVIGRVLKGNTPVSFLITWFVDTSVI